MLKPPPKSNLRIWKESTIASCIARHGKSATILKTGVDLEFEEPVAPITGCDNFEVKSKKWSLEYTAHMKKVEDHNSNKVKIYGDMLLTISPESMDLLETQRKFAKAEKRLDPLRLLKIVDKSHGVGTGLEAVELRDKLDKLVRDSKQESTELTAYIRAYKQQHCAGASCRAGHQVVCRYYLHQRTSILLRKRESVQLPDSHHSVVQVQGIPRRRL